MYLSWKLFLCLKMYIIVGEWVSLLQVEMEYYLGGVILVIWERIKLSDVPWIVVGWQQARPRSPSFQPSPGCLKPRNFGIFVFACLFYILYFFVLFGCLISTTYSDFENLIIVFPIYGSLLRNHRLWFIGLSVWWYVLLKSEDLRGLCFHPLYLLLVIFFLQLDDYFYFVGVWKTCGICFGYS